MRICRSLWVLVMVLWLASPEQGVWAAGNGALQPSAWIQTATPAGPQASGQFPGTGWFAAAEGQVVKKEAGFNWRAPFSSRTLVGLALTGSGVYFIGKGFDFHREANALYDRYLDTLDPAEITQLYQRTTQRDLKSRLSWTLGAVLTASGIRVLFGRQLAALHLQLAQPFPATHPRAGVRGAQVQLSRDF